jgi:hypothetical protein
MAAVAALAASGLMVVQLLKLVVLLPVKVKMALFALYGPALQDNSHQLA